MYSILLEQLIAMHKPACQQNTMVYSVWEDGEVTLEKGGELFGLRNLHQIELPLPVTLPVNALPEFNGFHSRIFVDGNEEAMAARQLITRICNCVVPA